MFPMLASLAFLKVIPCHSWSPIMSIHGVTFALFYYMASALLIFPYEQFFCLIKLSPMRHCTVAWEVHSSLFDSLLTSTFALWHRLSHWVAITSLFALSCVSSNHLPKVKSRWFVTISWGHKLEHPITFYMADFIQSRLYISWCCICRNTILLFCSHHLLWVLM